MNRILAIVGVVTALAGCGGDKLVNRPPPSRYVDTISQDKASKIDILFVVDNSGSMGAHQAALSFNFDNFMNFIDPDSTRSGEPNEVDYRLAVTTTDADNDKGALQGEVKIVYPGGGFDPLLKFKSNVVVGITGSSYEQGLRSAELALQNAAAEPPIKGDKAFLRDGAYLYIIIISDENDSSFGEVHYYLRSFEQLKQLGDTKAMVVSAIAGPVDGSCTDAAPGTRYQQITGETNGLFGSICTKDWVATLKDLAVSGIGLRKIFQLHYGPKNLIQSQPTDDPDSADIEVTVHYPCDGGDYTKYFDVCNRDHSKLSCPGEDPTQEMVCYPPHNHTDGWYYDGDTTSVIFTGKAIPGPGSQVVARYYRESGL